MKDRYLVEGPIPPLLISELMTLGNEDTGAGAISIFVGKVRDDSIEGKKVRALEYSAYSEMAEKEAGEIVKMVKSAFSDVRTVIIVHSTGIVRAGETSLFIMVTSGHRDHATRACRHTLEMVKEKLPVWKKELF
jgi:molybdopterin synthase catalytic subunit